MKKNAHGDVRTTGLARLSKTFALVAVSLKTWSKANVFAGTFFPDRVCAISVSLTRHSKAESAALALSRALRGRTRTATRTPTTAGVVLGSADSSMGVPYPEAQFGRHSGAPSSQEGLQKQAERDERLSAAKELGSLNTAHNIGSPRGWQKKKRRRLVQTCVGWCFWHRIFLKKAIFSKFLSLCVSRFQRYRVPPKVPSFLNDLVMDKPV